MLRSLWKFRLVLILAALVLVAGGAIAVAAKEGSFNTDNPKASSGASLEGGQQNQEPTKAPNTEPTATKGTEPTPVPHTDVSGKITSVDCEGGSITISEDNNGGSFTAALTGNTRYTGNAATCSDLKVGWHVSIEAVGNGETWTAEHVNQDDSGQSSGGGGGDTGGGAATPTPVPHH